MKQLLGMKSKGFAILSGAALVLTLFGAWEWGVALFGFAVLWPIPLQRVHSTAWKELVYWGVALIAAGVALFTTGALALLAVLVMVGLLIHAIPIQHQVKAVLVFLALLGVDFSLGALVVVVVLGYFAVRAFLNAENGANGDFFVGLLYAIAMLVTAFSVPVGVGLAAGVWAVYYGLLAWIGED